MGRLANALRAGGWFGPYGSNDPVLQALFGSQPTAAGVTLNETTALNLSAVWAAVTALAGPVGMLPLVLYKRTDRGKEPFLEHPLYRLLHDQPNPEQTAPVFRETLQAHVLTWGNGYAEIQRTPDGRPIALWTIAPDRVQPYRDVGTRQIRYRVTNDSGTQIDVDADRILHIPGLGFDGICGYSVIRKARESLGLTGAIERSKPPSTRPYRAPTAPIRSL